MTTLKVQFLTILAALSNFGGPIFKAMLTLLTYAVKRFVPDDVVGVQALAGAAPTAAHDLIKTLFEKVLSYMPNVFLKNTLRTLLTTVIAKYVDVVWDKLVANIPFVGNLPIDADDEAFFVAACN